MAEQLTANDDIRGRCASDTQGRRLGGRGASRLLWSV